MKRFTDKFNGMFVNIIADPGVVLFNVDEVARAIGYSKTSAVEYHIKRRIKVVAGEKFVDLKALNSLAKKATRTPTAKEFASWAKSVHDRELARQQAAEHIAKQSKPASQAWPWPKGPSHPDKATIGEHSIAVTGMFVGMTSDELKQWLIAEGYASTYPSNGNLKLSKWFKEQGFGLLPKAASGAVSNTPRITQSGVAFIKNRIASQRESNVLSFALTKSAEAKRLETGIEKLIVDRFSKHESGRHYTGLLHAPRSYELDEVDLIKIIKGIIAEVKLKELNGTK
jgi:hypothetical protein